MSSQTSQQSRNIIATTKRTSVWDLIATKWADPSVHPPCERPPRESMFGLSSLGYCGNMAHLSAGVPGFSLTNPIEFCCSCNLQVKIRLWNCPCRGHPASTRTWTTAPSSSLGPQSLRGLTDLTPNQVVRVWASPSSRRPGGSSNSGLCRSA